MKTQRNFLLTGLLSVLALAFHLSSVFAGQVLIDFEYPFYGWAGDLGIGFFGYGAASGLGATIKNPPSPTTVWLMDDGPTLLLNVTNGFTGVSLYYLNGNPSPGTLTVYSGLNGSGTALATVSLPQTPAPIFEVWLQRTLTHGTAQSFVITGTTGYLVLDDIRITGAFSPRLYYPPTASAVTAGTAALYASVNPEGAATSVVFEYATNPFYTGATATAPQNIGSGTADVAVTQPISALARGTTYYFRALAANPTGTTTNPAPGYYTYLTTLQTVATTQPATSVTASSFVLNGSVTPNELNTGVFFQYANNPGLSGAASTSGQNIGNGTAEVAVSATLSGLNPGVYYYRVVATNSAGTFTGDIVTVSVNPGYTVTSATSGAFTDISGTGTQIIAGAQDDVVSGSANLGFPFQFFGTSYSNVYANANGFLSFGGVLSGGATANNGDFQTSSYPSFDTIAVLWDDWITDAGVYLQTTGPVGQRVGIVQWNGHHFGGTADQVTFQVQLFEDSSDILMIYSDTATDTAYNNGVSATVGIRKAGAPANGRFVMWSFNSGGITSGTKLRFSPLKPIVGNLSMSGLTTTSATLRADVNPNNFATAAYFEYGVTTTYGSIATAALSPNDGAVAQPASGVAVGLALQTTYHYRVVASNSLGTTTSADASFILLPPSISAQPTNQTVAVSSNATISVTAAGLLPPAYQWLFNGAPISAATNNSLTLAHAGLANTGNYQVVVTNAYGSVTSSVATLTVVDPPIMLATPASWVANVAASAIFTAVATTVGGSAFTYQWYKGGVPLANGGNISGADAATLRIVNLGLPDATNYTVVVSNVYGTATSGVVTLTVTTFPGKVALGGMAPYAENFDSMGPAGTTTPNGWFVGTGNGAIAGTVVTVGTGSDNTGGSYNFGIAGVNASTDRALGSLPASGSTRDIEVHLVNASGAFLAQFTVYYTGEQWRQGGLSTVTNVLSLSYSADGTNFLPTGFHFDSPQIAGAAGALDGNAPANRTTSLFGIYSPPVPLTNGQAFFLRWGEPDVSSGNNHALAIDDVTILISTVQSSAIITAQPQSLAVIAGTATNLSVSALANLPLSYQWLLGGTPIAGATNASYAFTASPPLAGSYQVVLTNSYGSITSSIAALTVRVPPAITTQPQGFSGTCGVSSNLTVIAAGDAPLTYRWRLNGTNLPDASASYYLATTLIASAGSYTVIVTNAYGSITSSVANVIFNDTAPNVISGYAYIINLGDDLFLRGSATDSDAGCGDYIDYYIWDLNGHSNAVAGPSAGNAVLTWGQLNALGVSAVGTYPIALRVRDSLGAVGTSTATLSVYNNQPLASFTASPNPSACSQNVSIDGSSSFHSSPYQVITNYLWNFGDGSPIVKGGASQVTHVFQAFGSYVVTLIVTDNNSPAKTATNTQTIVVNQGNSAPVANAGGPYTNLIGAALTLNGTGSTDPDAGCGDSIVTYAWDLNNDSADDVSGATPTLSATQLAGYGLSAAGTHSIRLRVTDSLGALSTTNTTLTTIKLPATVTFGNLSQKYDGTPKSVTNSTSPGGLAVTVTYNGSLTAPSAVGAYEVVATINDATYQGRTQATLFISDPNIPAFRVLTDFDTNADGATPDGSLILSGGTLYGTTVNGGSSGLGSVFRVNVDGSGFTVLKHFTAADGSNPKAGLALSGGVLYGTTANGGASGVGTVFKVNTDGTGFAVLKAFGTSDGANPVAGLILSDGVLYGTTSVGGFFGSGTVFKLNTDGTSYAVLTHFNASDGHYPAGSLALSGNVLYGTAFSGGGGGGTVFRVNTDGSDFTKLKQLSESDGVNPAAGLTLAEGVLYGTTSSGGSSENGTLFKLNPDGTGYTVLRNLGYDSDGAFPYAGLTLSGSALYGTTLAGGSAGKGTLFKINTDGSGFSVLKHFDVSSGASPRAALTVCGSGVYGTAEAGGTLNQGVVFAFNLAPAITSQSPGVAARLGNGAMLAVGVSGDSPLVCQWFKNGVALTGASATNYTIAAVQESDLANYTVVVTNTFGSVTSSVATLSQELYVTIVTDPSGTSAVPGGSASFSVQAMGYPTNLAYQWRVNGTNLLNATNAAFSLASVAYTNLGSYSVIVTNSFGSVTSLLASLSRVCVAQSYTPATLPSASARASYSQAITGTGGWGAPYSYLNTSGLPTGMSLSSGGVLAGTPQAPGTYTISTTQRDVSGCSQSLQLQLSVACSTLTITPASLRSATNGVAYSRSLTAGLGTGPFTFAVSGGTLPTGIMLSTVGLLSGTPTSPGISSFTVLATDKFGCTGNRTYSYTNLVPATLIAFNYGNGTAALTFLGNPGSHYAVQRSSPLATSFLTIATITMPASGPYVFTDIHAPGPGPAFYRLAWDPANP